MAMYCRSGRSIRVPNTIATWQINWGDGTSDSVPGSAASASHIYADDSAGGMFEIIATATDEDGRDVASLNVTVENVAPTTVIGGVGTSAQLLVGPPPTGNTVAVNEGSNFILQIAAARDPGDDAVIQYAIDWDDGSDIETVAAPAASASGPIPTLDVTHIFADGGALRAISVTLIDEDGSFVNATTLDVDVRNVAPIVQMTDSTQGSGTPVTQGGSATVSFINPDDPSPADRTAGFTYSYDFDNDDVFEIEGINDATVVVPVAFLNVAGTRTVRGVITDKDGGTFEASTGVRVVADNRPPIGIAQAVSTAEDADVVITLDATDLEGDTLTYVVVAGPQHGTLGPIDQVTRQVTYSPSADYNGPDAFTFRANDGRGDSDVTTVSITVTPVEDFPFLTVSSFSPTDSGFSVRFDRAFDDSVINLTTGPAVDPAYTDVWLVGELVGQVAGSIVLDTDLQGFSFIRTGAVLQYDSYAVTLASGPEGFKDASGALDGNADGVAGDAYVTGFDVEGTGTGSFGLPDFMRGPGQTVNLPATGQGIPVSFESDGGIKTLVFHVDYDPALLSLTAAEAGSGLPAGADVRLATETLVSGLTRARALLS